MRKRDTQQLVNKLQEKYGDIEIPEFKYRSWKGEFHVAGGTGAQAIIDRALRDRDGYEERFENPALESVSDFEIASPLARGIRTRAGSILKEVIVEGSKRLVRFYSPPPLPIPDPSNDSSKIGSLERSEESLDKSSPDVSDPIPELVSPHRTVIPTDLHVFGNATNPYPPRLDRDLHVDKESEIIPAQSLPLPKSGKSTFGDPYAAPLVGTYYRIDKDTELPNGLAVVADGIDVNPDSKHERTHHTIYPTEAMTAAELIKRYSQIKTTKAGKKKDK